MDIKKVEFSVPSGTVVNYKGESVTCTHMKVTLGYQMGGYSNWTGEHSVRGYYMVVQPVTVSNKYGFACEQTTLFTGFKKVLVECSRRGKKAEANAVRIFEETLDETVRQVFPTGVDFASKVAA